MSRDSFCISKAIISPASRQSFIPLSHPSCGPLGVRGVRLAGLSDLVPPYEQVRPRQAMHSLNITLGGNATFAWTGGGMALSAGTVLVVPAGTACRFIVPPRRKWRTLWFHLADNDRWAHLRLQSPHRLPVGLPSPLVAAVEMLLAETISIAPQADEAARACADLVAIQIDRLLSADAALDPRQSHRIRQLADLWDEVETTLHEPWTVSRMAERLQMSEAAIHRLVRRHYGTSPLKRLVELRLRRARELLANTALTLDEIAALVGYATGFSLSKTFTKTFGRPPGTYRNGPPRITQPNPCPASPRA